MKDEHLSGYTAGLKCWVRLGVFCALALGTGCASNPPQTAGPQNTAGGKVPPLPPGVTLHRDKDINGVWLAEGFDFKGYDTLYIAPPTFAAIERPNEVQMRAMAMRVLPEEISQHMRDTQLFATVTAHADDVKPASKCLKMENTIIEYEKGGGGARYFAGVFGGGEPVIKVRGQILDGDKLMCVYELRRSGESVGSRLAGVWMSDEEIQRNDIRDLASDLADFFRRTANPQ
jgi:hypothetical protein